MWECTKSDWQNNWRSDGCGRCALKRMYARYMHRVPPAPAWWLRSRFAGRSKCRKRRPHGGSRRAVCALPAWVAMLPSAYGASDCLQAGAWRNVQPAREYQRNAAATTPDA
ncbi:conserved hypothetical protein [Xanthomonas oryzae pv. oryzae MAFF 311018]|nr:conserved hypothetical protein [Xanthomonas oryzae pv. oryzae MAFF 311018]